MNVKKNPFTQTAIILQQFFIEKLLSGRNSIQEIDIRKQNSDTNGLQYSPNWMDYLNL